MTPPEEDDTDDSDAETSWEKSDAIEDRFESAFGNHDLPGVLSVPSLSSVACYELHSSLDLMPASTYCSVIDQASHLLYLFKLHCSPPAKRCQHMQLGSALMHELANMHWQTGQYFSFVHPNLFINAIRNFLTIQPCFHAEREPVAASSPEYDSARVAAYASSRMPACYAVLFRVFDELHLHLPHFAPRAMLDFGSGPGTAVWAAREVRVASLCTCMQKCLRIDVQLMWAGLHD